MCKVKGDCYDFFAAFRNAPRPEKDQITPHECQECNQIRCDFHQLEAFEVPDEIIERHPDILPLFSEIAWRYYLPTYLDYSLRHPDSDAAGMLIINLDFESNPKRGFPPFQRDLLDVKELLAVRAYLERYQSIWDTDPNEVEERKEIRGRYAHNKSLNTEASKAGSG